MTKRIPERKRSKLTGRGKAPPFLMLRHYLLDSEEFGALSPIATKLFLEMARKYRGNNNGDISIAWSDCSKRGWVSKGTLQRARDELIDKGFAVVARHGRTRLSYLYALTFLPIDPCAGKGLEAAPTRTPTHAWRKSK